MLNYYSLAITKYEAIVLFKAFEDKPGFMSYEMFMRVFDRAEYTVNGGRSKSVAETARECKDSHSLEELDALIDEARAHSKSADYIAHQELILARISRALKNARTAQAVHDNFRRFGSFCLGWVVFFFKEKSLFMPHHADHPFFFIPATQHTPSADSDKDHCVTRDEFRSSFQRVLVLPDKEIDVLMDKFFHTGQAELNYDDFMTVIHRYADKGLIRN